MCIKCLFTVCSRSEVSKLCIYIAMCHRLTSKLLFFFSLCPQDYAWDSLPSSVTPFPLVHSVSPLFFHSFSLQPNYVCVTSKCVSSAQGNVHDMLPGVLTLKIISIATQERNLAAVFGSLEGKNHFETAMTALSLLFFKIYLFFVRISKRNIVYRRTHSPLGENRR